jgi:hypothetical protein
MARVSEWADVAMVEIWRFGFVLRDEFDVAMLTVENGCDIFLRICKAPALRAAAKPIIQVEKERKEKKRKNVFICH